MNAGKGLEAAMEWLLSRSNDKIDETSMFERAEGRK